MKLITLSTLVLLFGLGSCKKLTLDALAFPSEKLDSYAFENYNGDHEIGVPDSILADPANYTLVTMSSVDANSGESYTIYGVYIGDMNTIATDTVILYLHGQSLHMDAYFERASLLANLGGKYHYGVLMIDYRGFGMSEGSSTEQGLYEDANAAIDWLKNHNADPSKTVYYGYSLGAIPAIDRAAYRTDFVPGKLIVESPLASVANLVQTSTLIAMNPGFVTTLDFPNAEKIKDVQVPLMWLHGQADSYVAIENGELIYANYTGSEKLAVRVPDADHTEVPSKLGLPNYLSQVLGFIRL